MLRSAPAAASRGTAAAPLRRPPSAAPFTLSARAGRTHRSRAARVRLAVSAKTVVANPAPGMTMAEAEDRLAGRPVDQLPKNNTSPATWEAMWTVLRSKGLKFVDAGSVGGSSGPFGGKTRIVDIRPEVDYQAAHVEGALNVELYRQIAEWDIKSTLKRIQLAAFGIYPGVEENPNFIAAFAAAVPNKSEKIVLLCEYGGSLEPTLNLKNGRQSRALTAAFMLYRNGYKNVTVVEGGMAEWFKRDLPCVGEGFIAIPFLGLNIPAGILKDLGIEK